MKVYVFSVEKINPELYRMYGFEKSDRNFFFVKPENVGSLKLTLIGPRYKNPCEELIEIFWESITSELKAEICYVLVDKKDFKEMKKGLNEYALYNTEIDIISVSGGMHCIDIEIYVEKKEEDSEYLYFDPLLDSFSIPEKYCKSALNNLKDGPCLN